MASIDDLVTHERAELERIATFAIMVEGAALARELDWRPEVALDAAEFWQLADCLSMDAQWGERCVHLVICSKDGLSTWLRWQRLYDGYASCRDWSARQAAMDALTEIKRARQLVGLLGHFSYAWSDEVSQ